MSYAPSIALIALSAALAACSPTSSPAERQAPVTAGSAADPAAPAVMPAPAITPVAAGADDRVLALEGLGALKVGAAVPAGGAWTAAGAQVDDGCRAVRSTAYPGVYALVEGGKVRRVTVGQGSDVKLVEGVGVGSSETEVRKWFAGFRSEAHKYEGAPAKYLTAPNASKSESALRFEIGTDSKVKAMHVGQMPQLAYVEGCG